ncbi:putative hydrolase of the HAD superfamily [Clostridium amylolyticum]|uniref:Putative hydrolase of the HAD superfamily n=1 Tax=Clostridium amylolyticum TaxID=1121298 RepID=A0A1M6CRR9_9CLOT|nr:HAD family phosphatase [Clostridium amylolyticum]SHI63494.1 putative hydrolase of the HAD superfamily [Clostridium amylolyticum]
MIKNIVFDIGNVLVEYRPEAFIKKFNYTHEINERIMKVIFGSRHWPELDRGTLKQEEATKLFCMDEPELEKEINELMDKWMDMLLPMEDSIKLLLDLKQKGYKVFVLSNYHEKAFKRIQEENEFFNIIDGGVISYEIKYIKPQREIYETLINKYQLNPEETVFIDDVKENLHGAEKVGINTILFKDVLDTKDKLKGLSVIV